MSSRAACFSPDRPEYAQIARLDIMPAAGDKQPLRLNVEIRAIAKRIHRKSPELRNTKEAIAECGERTFPLNQIDTAIRRSR
jgi:hypothetical protein